MGVIEMNPGRVEIIISADAQMMAEPPLAATAPGGLYPLQTRSFEMDEYRIMAGWPVEVPKYDIQCRTMISASGETFSNRDDPTSVETSALIRWVADATLYDETALLWRPLVDNTGVRSFWQTSVEYAPVLIHDYEYRVKDERFIVTALNFDSDTKNHMWADFAATIGGSTGYTVLMVMSPNSAYGNNVDVPYNGLWCPGGPTPEGNTFAEDPGPAWNAVTMQGSYLYYATESREPTRAISITPQLNSNAPMYLAMVFGYPESTFYVGEGPESIRVQTIPTGTDLNGVANGVVLGRSNGDVLHTADMALLDLSVYADRLTADEVQNEFAALSRAYGGAE